MSTHDPLPRMYRHMEWADARSLATLRDMTEPPPHAVDVFAHVLAAEHIWLRRIDGVVHLYDVWQPIGLDECERLARANHAGFTRVLAEADRLRPVSYQNLAGVSYTTPLEEILIHVSHHGMYHRGQIALLVRAAGGTPMPTDYIVYQRETP
ncbi:MAG: damage-inducible protein DinB [Gemmatimonadaceae bacterium]|nr:damage-inducible protein DinB [Gemmatimonadaceae bacterium]